jgi:hypothetical protein
MKYYKFIFLLFFSITAYAHEIPIINLSGNYHEMGRQYGQQQKAELKNFYNDIIYLLEHENHNSHKKVVAFAHELFNHYPKRFRELLYGMSEGSHLSLDQQLVINAFEYYIYNAYGSHFVTEEPHAIQGCSGIAVWGPYTKNHQLLFGRNYDFAINIDRFKKYLAITVLHPTGSGNTVAMVTFLGTLNATTLMNDKGLFLELNASGASAKTPANYRERLSAPVTLLAMMTDSDNLTQLDQQLKSRQPDWPFIINVADKNSALSYEWSPFGVSVIHAQKPGLLVATNNYVTPNLLQSKPTDQPTFTLTRKKNLLNLAAQDKGQINFAVMRKILGTDITHGGATTKYTGFQVIAIPSEKIFWVLVPGSSLAPMLMV